jgi:hypothetical protein
MRWLVSAIVLVLILALVGTCTRLQQVSDAYKTKNEEVSIWRDKYQRSNAELVVTKLSLANAKKLESELLDSLRKVTGIKPRTVTKVVTVTKVTRDTIPFYINKPRWSNKWSSFEWLDNKLVYSVSDSIALINHTKHYGFLNLKTKYVTRVVTFNPQTTIKGVKSLEVIPKENKISLGLQAGYGIQLSQGYVRSGFNFGVGISYRLLP